MFDHLLRGLKDRLLAPLARLCIGIPPNLLTLVALVLGLGAAVAAAQSRWHLGLVLWLANRVVDGLDGAVARLAERQTDFGGYFDILCDFVVYAMIPVGFAQSAQDRPEVMALVAMLASFFVNAASWMYLSAILEKRSAGAQATGELTSVTMPPAIIAGFETVVFFSLFFLFPRRTEELFMLMAVLVSVGVVQRLVWARKVL